MEQKAPLIVCVTGAAGQIGYSIAPLIGSGEFFGHDQLIELRFLDIAPMMPVLQGLVMEMQDCAYTAITKVKCGADPKEMFKDMDIGIFLGGFPRKEGMERKDLIAKNCSIFKEQGIALNEVGKATTKCLVVANPANTNCLILSSFAPKIPKKNFTCLTRLDHNRTIAQLAEKANAPVNTIKNVTIWGNHSSTQFPDTVNATINGKPVAEVITDAAFLTGTMMTTVQKRGAAIIAARKASSALSAAKAIRDHMRSWMFGTPEGEWVSMGVIAENTKYEIDHDLCFSLPVKCKGFEYEIVEGLAWNAFAKEKIALTMKELQDERKDALGK